MGPPLYMRPVVDRNVVMRRMNVLVLGAGPPEIVYLCSPPI
jgi:hypothetical protein